MQNSLRIPLLCWLKQGPFKNHSTWPSYAVHFRLTKRNWITGKELLLKQTNFSSVRLMQNAFRRKKKLKNKISSSTLRVHSEVWEQMKQKFIKKKITAPFHISIIFFALFQNSRTEGVVSLFIPYSLITPTCKYCVTVWAKKYADSAQEGIPWFACKTQNGTTLFLKHPSYNNTVIINLKKWYKVNDLGEATIFNSLPTPGRWEISS